MVAIRPEAPADHDAIREVHRRAFGPASGEAELVDALRAAGAHEPGLCLVAVDGDAIVGHVFLSRARLDSGDAVLALAPMAVRPDRQRRGVGTRLVAEALERAATTDYPLVVVVGHPEYYPRLGFERADRFGVRAPWEIPPQAWMLHRLPAYRPAARGLVTYPAPFDAVA
ncbi:MAG TPA: N-acetyltransferase [Solirubrobacteraceae bacterium]|nr:N-acetyltransferase [Solirubrobacteraceae bacterium]